MYLLQPLTTVLTLLVGFYLLLVAAFNISAEQAQPPATPTSIVRPAPAQAATCRPWTCGGESNSALINNLYNGNIIKSKEVKSALLAVDRGNYVSPHWTQSAYEDAPLGIGYGQTISAPHMHANALEELLPAIKKAVAKDKDAPIRILDVGSGSGYLSVAFGRLLNTLGIKDGKVFGIDVVQELVNHSKQNAKKEDGDLLSSGKVTLSIGDGWKGLPSEGPFTAIHVGAGADSLPKTLVNQLQLGGRMVIPVETARGYQGFYRIDRVALTDDGRFHESDFEMKELFPVRYVPLVHGR